ncbi:MAG: CBS domain-containing protein [Pyrinomonadaceae bacterium]|nr:CBS domain-containing protein [Blastocatellia bacterium]MCW5957203.1 CBS domain-containing protein [Pyrinomonadaceae bacterium]
MGEKTVKSQADESEHRAFTRAVLNDLYALEKMLEGGKMESDASRIGAEQEMFLVDSSMHPAPRAIEVIESARDSRLTTEIGRFNLEANLTPLAFEGDCLSKLERELNEVIGIVKRTMRQFDGDVVLCGILPTIQKSDLVEEYLTPFPRYEQLNRVLTALHGEDRMVHIKGLDEIRLHLHDTFIEFCNTSFQVHMQVPVNDFTRFYNWAQAITAPVLASAVNSPILLAHRLWHETRLALFQQSVDERGAAHQERSRPARVTFGHEWVKDSILDVFHEDVARFRIILTRDLEEDSLEVLKAGGIPNLSAWRMHNGTVWRWNRACYGVMDGVPGLRIEARFLPAGPTVADEMANSALFLGLMRALPEINGDITKLLSFDDAKTNFFSAARFGLKSQLTWLDKRTYTSMDLILSELLPLARHGLNSAAVDTADIDRFTGILEDRVKAEMTGAKWILDSLSSMDKSAKTNIRMRALTSEMIKHQEKGELLHTWPLARIADHSEWVDNFRTVEQFMSRDLFTVRPDDVVDLAASLMEWKHIRHIPVENDKGELVGIVSHRDLLRFFAEEKSRAAEELIVRDIMKTKLFTIEPETRTLDALYLMRDKNIGCLPVCKDGKLIGILTAHDFLTVSTRLLEERLKMENYERRTNAA